MSFVLDASVVLSWCLEESQSLRTRPVIAAMETTSAIVPAIWQLEVANGLAMSERRGRIDEAGISRFLGLLLQLPIEVDLQCAHLGLSQVLPLARRQGLTAYDASYLELAVRLGARIATLDDRMESAATAAGVQLMLPAQPDP